MRYSKYNIVIIGSGISGLFLANKLAQSNKFSDGILIVTKENLFSGSSALAQGGIVSVIPEINPVDSIESHIKDTIKAGCGLNDINTVQFVSSNSSGAIQDLINFGVKFDRNDKKQLNFTLEGAHSCPRILHSNGDSTGRVIEQALCKCLEDKNNVELYDNTIAVELLIDDDNTAKGVVVYNHQSKYYEAIYASNIVIATGGIGQLYKNTTNPSVSTGDGIALAYKAGCKLENMEFVQFHPTALYVNSKDTMPLISESARGEGAKLVNLQGEYFAKNYHHLADLAPRDIVARAINSEMTAKDEKYVNLDISQIGIEKFKKRFPTITALLEENNIDINLGLIPVVPSEHYFMGGIKVDLSSKTSINNLYAVGECASTGLHGANRLASNSLLECVVFAGVLAKKLSALNTEPPKKHGFKVKRILDKYSNSNDDFVDNCDVCEKLFEKLKCTMTENVGIIRTKESLDKAGLDIIQIEKELNKVKINDSKPKYELKNALVVSRLIVDAALRRENSIGAHYRADCIENITSDERKDNYEDKVLAK